MARYPGMESNLPSSPGYLPGGNEVFTTNPTQPSPHESLNLGLPTDPWPRPTETYPPCSHGPRWVGWDRKQNPQPTHAPRVNLLPLLPSSLPAAIVESPPLPPPFWNPHPYLLPPSAPPPPQPPASEEGGGGGGGGGGDGRDSPRTWLPTPSKYHTMLTRRLTSGGGGGANGHSDPWTSSPAPFMQDKLSRLFAAACATQRRWRRERPTRQVTSPSNTSPHRFTQPSGAAAQPQ